MKKYNIPVTLSLALLAFFSLGLLACSSDDPTTPQPTPQDPGNGGGASAAWNITVTPEDRELLSTGDDSTTINIRVRNASTGAAPPNGTTIAVTATNGVFPNGFDSIALELINGEASVRFTPSLPGTAVITAQLENSFGQARITILDPADSTFLLSHVEPSSGSPSGGDTVTIFGQGIRDPVRVTIGGNVAQVLSVSSGRIRVVTPPSNSPPAVGETQPVAVTVTNAVGTEFEASDSLPNGFIYAHGGSFAQPQIFSVTPNTGPNEGGTEVVINGSGFQSPVQVLFGQSQTTPGESVEAQILSVAENRIRVLSPPARSFGNANLNNPVDIRVVNLNSGFSSVAPNAFRYGVPVLITSIAPGAGDYRGGDLVTLFGEGFDEPVSVTIGDVPQQVISVTGSEIVVRTVEVRVDNCSVSQGTFSGNVGTTRVVNIETGNFGTGPGFEYLIPQPLITGVSPSSGPQAGGNNVTIAGSGFEAPVRVLFGDQAASIQSTSETSIVARAPEFTGSFPTQSCTTAEGETGRRNAPVSVSVTVINLTTDCTDVLTNAYTFTPTDTTCRAAPTNGGDDDPVADFTFQRNGFDVDFTDQSSPTPTAWAWAFGDGATSSNQNPSHTYAAAGTYDVTLTVQPGGDSVTKQVTVPFP